MVTRDAHFCCSAGEGESPTGAPPDAEEGRAGLEDAVGCNPLVRSSEGRRDMSLGLQVRTWSGAHMELTGTPLSVGRWRGTTATLGSLLERLEAVTCARF